MPAAEQGLRVGSRPGKDWEHHQRVQGQAGLKESEAQEDIKIGRVQEEGTDGQMDQRANGPRDRERAR